MDETEALRLVAKATFHEFTDVEMDRFVFAEEGFLVAEVIDSNGKEWSAVIAPTNEYAPLVSFHDSEGHSEWFFLTEGLSAKGEG